MLSKYSSSNSERILSNIAKTLYKAYKGAKSVFQRVKRGIS